MRLYVFICHPRQGEVLGGGGAYMARVDEIISALDGKVPEGGNAFIEVNKELGFSISVSPEGAVISYMGQQVHLSSDEINNKVRRYLTPVRRVVNAVG